VLAVLVGAGLGFQQLAEDRDQASQDRDQAIQDRQLTRQGQASERFTRAIDQLGSSRLETRIGGIYGLDQIAEQSPVENAVPVGEVLVAWLNGRPRARGPLRGVFHWERWTRFKSWQAHQHNRRRQPHRGPTRQQIGSN
jgi:hypothetical protein